MASDYDPIDPVSQVSKIDLELWIDPNVVIPDNDDDLTPEEREELERIRREEEEE